jgi:hypothetical protein
VEEEKEIKMEIEEPKLEKKASTNSNNNSPLKMQPKQQKLEIFIFDITKDFLRKICKTFEEKKITISNDMLLVYCICFSRLIRMQSSLIKLPYNDEYAQMVFNTLLRILEQIDINKYNEEGRVLMMFLFILTEILKKRDKNDGKEAKQVPPPITGEG